jgi:hypothetical protein
MPQGQNIMEDGPGLAERARQTKATVNSLTPETTLPKATPAADNPDKINKHAKYGDRKGETRIDVSQMTKPLGSLKNGTPHVPETGNYKLHKGEAVVPKEKNMSDPFALVPGRTEPKSAKKEIKRMEITKSHNGKHIVKHVHHHPSHEDETHVMNDMAALHSHLDAHNDDASGTPAAPQMTASQGAPAAPPAGAPPVAPAV